MWEDLEGVEPKRTLSRLHLLVLLEHQRRAPALNDLIETSCGRKSAYLKGGLPTPYDGLWDQTLPQGFNPITLNVLKVKKLIATMIMPVPSQDHPKDHSEALIEVNLTDEGGEA